MHPANGRPIRAAAEKDMGDFRISYEWKEILVYWEGDVGFAFDCGWGVDPPSLSVPFKERWDSIVPRWLNGRRAIVVERLGQHSGHRVFDGDYPEQVEEWRLRRRTP